MKRSNLPLLMYGALAVVLLTAWLAFWSLNTLGKAQYWFAHTMETLTATQEIQVAMAQANSAARGYLLNGSADYEKNFNAAVVDAHSATNKLQKLTEDNSSQQQRLAVLRQRVSARFGVLDVAIAMRKAHPDAPPSAFVSAPALAESPDGGLSPRSVLEDIKNEETQLLASRQKDAEEKHILLVVVLSGVFILDLVLLVLAFRLLERVADDRQTLSDRAAEIAVLNAELTKSNEELERRVEQRTRELAASNQELEAFSYSVSHDLRAPLRTIDGFSLALKEDFSECLNAEGQDYIERVRNGVQRMGSLIDALLQLSRVTRSEVQRERVDLSAIVQQVFQDLRATAPERDVEMMAQPGVLAMADPRLVRIAFENLVGNAFKYSSRKEHARIEFGSDAREGRTVYFIRDNGVGFDMQYVDRLFTAFQRLHGDREFKGSGIGLATVSRIIRRHHGDIWAEGEVDKGATFYFTLGASNETH
jgi:signal transduction histidine kinase